MASVQNFNELLLRAHSVIVSALEIEQPCAERSCVLPRAGHAAKRLLTTAGRDGIEELKGSLTNQVWKPCP